MANNAGDCFHVQAFAETFACKTVTLNVKAFGTVVGRKAFVGVKVGLPVGRQCLLFHCN